MPLAVVIAAIGAYVCVAAPQLTSIACVVSVVGVAASLSFARRR